MALPKGVMGQLSLARSISLTLQKKKKHLTIPAALSIKHEQYTVTFIQRKDKHRHFLGPLYDYTDSYQSYFWFLLNNIFKNLNSKENVIQTCKKENVKSNVLKTSRKRQSYLLACGGSFRAPSEINSCSAATRASAEGGVGKGKLTTCRTRKLK